MPYVVGGTVHEKKPFSIWDVINFVINIFWLFFSSLFSSGTVEDNVKGYNATKRTYGFGGGGGGSGGSKPNIQGFAKPAMGGSCGGGG